MGHSQRDTRQSEKAQRVSAERKALGHGDIVQRSAPSSSSTSTCSTCHQARFQHCVTSPFNHCLIFALHMEHVSNVWPLTSFVLTRPHSSEPEKLCSYVLLQIAEIS